MIVWYHKPSSFGETTLYPVAERFACRLKAPEVLLCNGREVLVFYRSTEFQGTLVSLKSKPLLRQADTSPVIPTRTNSVFKMMKAIGVSD